MAQQRAHQQQRQAPRTSITNLHVRMGQALIFAVIVLLALGKFTALQIEGKPLYYYAGILSIALGVFLFLADLIISPRRTAILMFPQDMKMATKKALLPFTLFLQKLFDGLCVAIGLTLINPGFLAIVQRVFAGVELVYLYGGFFIVMFALIKPVYNLGFRSF